MSEEELRKFNELADTMLRNARADYEALTASEREHVDRLMEASHELDFLREIAAKVVTGQMSEADAMKWLAIQERQKEDQLRDQMKGKGATPKQIEQAIKGSYKRWPGAWQR